MAEDNINHPKHYTSHPSGVECITITEHMTFNAGNAMKYIWRTGLKSEDPIEDLKKALWYIHREIARLSKSEGPVTPTELCPMPSKYDRGDCCGHEPCLYLDEAAPKLAAGCCSAVSPCAHQRQDPYTICDACKRAGSL